MHPLLVIILSFIVASGKKKKDWKKQNAATARQRDKMRAVAEAAAKEARDRQAQNNALRAQMDQASLQQDVEKQRLQAENQHLQDEARSNQFANADRSMQVNGPLGRRRREMRRQMNYGGGFLSGVADTDVCMATNGQFGSYYMAEMFSTLKSNCENSPKIAQLADKMGAWCRAQGVQRRRLHGDDVEDHEIAEIEMFDHLHSVASIIGEDEFESLRRRQCPVVKVQCSSPSSFDFGAYTGAMGRAPQSLVQSHYQNAVPSDMWRQCSGYSTALAMLTQRTHHARSADVFIVNAKGSPSEMKDGCGSVVNKVNYAVSQGQIPGLRMAKDVSMNDVVIVDPASPLSSQLAPLLTSVTLISGMMAMKLFEVCTSYQDMMSIM